MNKNMTPVRLSIILSMMVVLVVPGYASEVGFKGNLLDRPCQIEQTSQDITFMDTATSLYHFWPGRSYEKEFNIKLINCNSKTIGKTVELTFKGLEESSLPGYLQVSGVNKGKLGIGIIDTDGRNLLKTKHINNSGLGVKIDKNSVTLEFKAFVQATREAITNKTVQPGNYNSTATFELLYR